MTRTGQHLAGDGSWRRMLTARPVRNEAARLGQSGEGNVTVRVTKQRPWYLLPPLSWIVPFRRERAAALDRVGSRVWRLCDGERTVEGVIDEFASSYHLTFHEARVAVTGYLKELIQRGVLAISIPEDDTT